MRFRRWQVFGATCLAVLAVAGVAIAGGVWPGLAPNGVVAPGGDVRYVASRASAATTVRARRVRDGRTIAALTVEGAWGIPAVTINGIAGGLSPAGRLLVLVQPPTGRIREQSRFLLLTTPSLSRAATIVLEGEFGFDALSPDGRTLYLIEHADGRDLVSYVVRAYDLRARKLLPGPVVDKSQVDEKMRGYPVARATTRSGSWVYTLYRRTEGRPFVHALNAARRTAFCIDLPWRESLDDLWTAKLDLSADGRALLVRSPSGATAATIDTATRRVR